MPTKPTLLILNDPADAKQEKALSKHLHVAEKIRKDIIVEREPLDVLGLLPFAEIESSDPNAEGAESAYGKALLKVLDRVDIVVLLLTDDTLVSRYWAAEAAVRKGKRLIPVLVRPSEWKSTTLGALVPLPSNGKGVELWTNVDSAWTDVVGGLRQVWDAVAQGLPKGPPAAPAPAQQPQSTATTGAPTGTAAAAASVPKYQPLDPPPPAPPAVPAGNDIKILFLSANQADGGRLMVTEEYRQLQKRLQGADHGKRFQIIYEPELRVNELADALMRYRPQIVHFSGHGTKEGALVLVNPDQAGKSTPMPPVALQQIFKVLGKGVYCVVLNSCWSVAHEDQGLALADVVGCVVGTSTAIADRAAIEFTAQFYSTLAFGESVKDAFDLARANIHAATGKPDEVMRLVSRKTVDPSTFKLIS